MNFNCFPRFPSRGIDLDFCIFSTARFWFHLIRSVESGRQPAIGIVVLQTEDAQVLKLLAVSNDGLVAADKQDLAAWLSGTSEDGCAPSSRSIFCISKQ